MAKKLVMVHYDDGSRHCWGPGLRCMFLLLDCNANGEPLNTVENHLHIDEANAHFTKQLAESR